MTRFPGAPEGSYIDENGWLIIDSHGGQAWTEAEWNTTQDKPPGSFQSKYANEGERDAARRQSKREYEQRQRAERDRERKAEAAELARLERTA